MDDVNKGVGSDVSNGFVVMSVKTWRVGDVSKCVEGG